MALKNRYRLGGLKNPGPKWSDLGPLRIPIGRLPLNRKHNDDTRPSRSQVNRWWECGDDDGRYRTPCEWWDERPWIGCKQDFWSNKIFPESWLINESDWIVDTRYDENASFCGDMFCHENRWRKKLEKNMQRWRTHGYMVQAACGQGAY